MNVHQAIEHAEKVLPSARSSGDDLDPHWQAIIAVGEYVQSDPEPVWDFVARWGTHKDDGLRTAIATCLLEHLLEHHFATIFPRVERLATTNHLFADTVSLCSRFGEAEQPANAIRFDQLMERLYGPPAA